MAELDELAFLEARKVAYELRMTRHALYRLLPEFEDTMKVLVSELSEDEAELTETQAAVLENLSAELEALFLRRTGGLP